jgi:copper chaperone
METLKFKTSIKCTGCLEKVSPRLNQMEGIEKWEVDIKTPNKVLTVESNGATEEHVISTLDKIGFKAEPIH